MGKFDIRVLRPGDAALLNRIAPGVFDGPVVPEYRDRFLASDNHVMAVALVEDSVVGMGSGVFYCHPDKPETLWINEIGTADEWLRQGIATQILNELLSQARKRGVKEAWLGTEPDNDAARGLYRSFSPDEETEFIYYEFDPND